MIKTTLPSIMFFGREATDEYAQMIYTILGSDCCYATEEEFCKMTGCRPDKLEDWLLRDFIQHNIEDVEHLQEKAGAHPVNLIQERDPFYVIRLFSPNPERINCPAVPTIVKQ